MSRFPFCAFPSCSSQARAYLYPCTFLTSCFWTYLCHAALSRLYLNHSLIRIFFKMIITPPRSPGKASWGDCSAALHLQVLNQGAKLAPACSQFPWMQLYPHRRVTMKEGNSFYGPAMWLIILIHSGLGSIKRRRSWTEKSLNAIVPGSIKVLGFNIFMIWALIFPFSLPAKSLHFYHAYLHMTA